MRRPSRQTLGYPAVLLLSFVLAMAAGYTALGRQIDTDVYDWMFRLAPAEDWKPESALLVIDEDTLLTMGGVRRVRAMLAEGLERISPSGPKVVAIDLTLAEEGDPADDARLEAAMRKTPGLVLAVEMLPGGRGWQEPYARFRPWCAAAGHVHAAPDELDGVNRQIPLEKAAANKRYWALSLEAFRLSRGVRQFVESPEDVQVGAVTIPAVWDHGRTMWIRYLPEGPDGATRIPRVSVRQLRDDSGLARQFSGRVVFVGVTAQSAARDRLMTPYSAERPLPGVEIHANAFETMARGRFLSETSDVLVVAVCLLLAAVAGTIFGVLSGWPAYGLGAALLAATHAIPFALFSAGAIFPYTAPVAAAWLSVASAASYQHFVVRRRLRRAEAETARYQQAVHFVTHEMRTPLTAIQGSSELMSRYNLSDEKRKQVADLIFSESRRLARMIETFLSVERLSAGQMEMKTEPFRAWEVVEACLERARPLADRKQIRLRAEPLADEPLAGDRELMEYAIYNLINNAIKYSPPETEVTVRAARDNGHLLLSVEDQGMGMDEKELASVFQRFYRTRKAVASGEAGMGIGLSIVEQIVTHHGGKIEVTSQPGKGSCFTLVLPAPAAKRQGVGAKPAAGD